VHNERYTGEQILDRLDTVEVDTLSAGELVRAMGGTDRAG